MPRRNQKRWRVPKRLPDVVSEELHVFPTTFRQILYNRGIVDSGSAGRFLAAENPVHDPFLLRDMPKAVERVLTAVKEYEKILVFGDYDVDGVTATVLLFEFLTKVGARVMKYIPNRFEEGYGFSMNSLEGVLQQKPDMLITVDCGVRSVEEVELANQQGIEVIITDHHLP